MPIRLNGACDEITHEVLTFNIAWCNNRGRQRIHLFRSAGEFAGIHNGDPKIGEHDRSFFLGFQGTISFIFNRCSRAGLDRYYDSENHDPGGARVDVQGSWAAIQFLLSLLRLALQHGVRSFVLASLGERRDRRRCCRRRAFFRCAIRGSDMVVILLQISDFLSRIRRFFNAPRAVFAPFYPAARAKRRVFDLVAPENFLPFASISLSVYGNSALFFVLFRRVPAVSSCN